MKVRLMKSGEITHNWISTLARDLIRTQIALIDYWLWCSSSCLCRSGIKTHICGCLITYVKRGLFYSLATVHSSCHTQDVDIFILVTRRWHLSVANFCVPTANSDYFPMSHISLYDLLWWIHLWWLQHIAHGLQLILPTHKTSINCSMRRKKILSKALHYVNREHIEDQAKANVIMTLWVGLAVSRVRGLF